MKAENPGQLWKSLVGKLCTPAALALAVVATSGAAHAAKPVIGNIPDQNVNEGSLLNFTVVATDADSGDTITYGLDNPPSGASINSSTGQFSWTPTESQGPATYTIKVKATDTTSNAVTKSVKVTVKEVNETPYLNVEDDCVWEGENVCFTAGYDCDIPANSLTFSATGLPAGATLDKKNGLFKWVPSETQGGQTFTINFKVTDGKLTATDSIDIDVKECNEAPVLPLILDRYWKGGTPFSLQVKATDVDIPVQTLSYCLECAPDGATINSETGLISWPEPPNVVDDECFDFKVKVKDNGSPSRCDEQKFKVVLTTKNLNKTVDGVTFGSELVSKNGPIVTVHYWVRNETKLKIRNVIVDGSLNGLLYTGGDPIDFDCGDVTTTTKPVNKTFFKWNNFDVRACDQQDLYITILVNPGVVTPNNNTTVADTASVKFDAIGLTKPGNSKALIYGSQVVGP